MNKPLLRIIRQVRNRWRFRLALRGFAIILSAGLAVFLFSAYGMDRLRFTPTAVLAFQIIAYGSLVALSLRFLVMPLRRRVTDEQVVLYLEEHEPSLNGQVMSAIESGRQAEDGLSQALMERVVERALRRCAAIDDGRRIEHAGIVRSGGYLAGATLTALALFVVNPAFIRTSTPFLITPWSGGTQENPYAIGVLPGDSTVARGADLKITAELIGFDTDDVEILMRADGTAEWERWSMTVDEETGDYLILLFDLTDSTEYFVEAGGVRSPVYRLAVTDLPYVERIALQYFFPAYTGMSPQRQEDTGDIAALAGTRVLVDVKSTMTVSAGALAVGGDTLPMEVRPDGGLSGQITVRENGSYRVLLEAPDGRLVAASPEYFIDVLADQPPAVSFSKPGRDIQVTSVDEVFAEVRVEDDFGIRSVELSFSVNGGPEQTVALYGGRANRKQLTAGHTFYLEEYALEPGDVVSYYASARDARAGVGPSMTDIYFVTIRPFDRSWIQGQQGGQQSDGGLSVGELSRRQRDIVAATFKVLRDSSGFSQHDYRDNLSTVTLAQGRLREEVETLVRQIGTRGIVQMDSTFRVIGDALGEALDAMEEAEQRLGMRQPREALPPEQRSLQQLQRAEAQFRERQLSRGQPGQGGGQDDNAAELAELFELELDRLRNQYEEVRRGERQEANAQIDETLEKLRQLARRQQQQNERMRAQAQRGNPSGNTGRGQRRLANEAVELARRLERLAREQSRPDLQEAARRIREATDAMRRAAAQGAAGSAQGNQALNRLRDARRQLERNRSTGLRRDIEDAQQRAERLANQQRAVTSDVARLSANPQTRLDQLRRLIEQKERMAAEIDGLEAQLDRLARDARDGQPAAARRLREVAGQLRDSRLRDKILYSRGVIQRQDSLYARNFEEQIGSDLESLAQGIADAAQQLGEPRERRLGRALDQTRDLADALESLGERVREAQEEGRERQERGREEQGARTGERRLDPDAQRQFGRELRERRGELRELRGRFQREGVDVSRLDEIIRALGRYDNPSAISSARALERLETEIIQGLKEFEFALRRQLLAGDEERASLSGSDAVPNEYREMVEEYYRRLAARRR